MRRSFSKSFAFMAAILAMGGTSVAASHGGQKEGIVNMENLKKPSADMSKFVGAGSANPYKYNKTPKKNQRQKRKLWSQVPQMRKKHAQ